MSNDKKLSLEQLRKLSESIQLNEKKEKSVKGGYVYSRRGGVRVRWTSVDVRRGFSTRKFDKFRVKNDATLSQKQNSLDDLNEG